ncbi:DNA helicase [Pediococcus acidilactici]|nr:DNA helicase [Pediococcus acidilactici]
MDPQTVLKSNFGYDTFRPGQARVIDAVLHRQNVLAIMPTGAASRFATKFRPSCNRD